MGARWRRQCSAAVSARRQLGLRAADEALLDGYVVIGSAGWCRAVWGIVRQGGASRGAGVPRIAGQRRLPSALAGLAQDTHRARAMKGAIGSTMHRQIQPGERYDRTRVVTLPGQRTSLTPQGRRRILSCGPLRPDEDASRCIQGRRYVDIQCLDLLW